MLAPAAPFSLPFTSSSNQQLSLRPLPGPNVEAGGKGKGTPSPTVTFSLSALPAGFWRSTSCITGRFSV
ncbi:MAG: hypothetical protein ACKESB_03525 [Candidatus Hodgkinia cicadicola]